MKFCTKCKKLKHLCDFQKNKSRKDGYSWRCKECTSVYQKLYYRRNQKRERKKKNDYYKKHGQSEKYKNQRRASKLKCKYDITLEDYNKMFEAQGGCCLICGKSQKELGQRLRVDHSHETGKIRGLLCVKCNLGLGCFDIDNEGAELLCSAISYIKNNEVSG